MKKRAILTAPSYDDFKNLVAAAHQKPVDQKDMQVLQGAAVQQFPPIHNKAATTVRTSASRSGLGRRRRTGGTGTAHSSTSAAQPSLVSNINTLRTFQNAWAKCATPSAKQELLQAVNSAAWQQWAQGAPDTVDGACVADMLQEAAQLPDTLCVAWCAACVGSFSGSSLGVWGGLLSPSQQQAVRTALQKARKHASGDTKSTLERASEKLHFTVTDVQ